MIDTYCITLLFFPLIESYSVLRILYINLSSFVKIISSATNINEALEPETVKQESEDKYCSSPAQTLVEDLLALPCFEVKALKAAHNCHFTPVLRSINKRRQKNNIYWL